MPRRLLVPLALLAALVLVPAASADVGRFIPAEGIDGPVTALGDLDVARDGTGAVAYVKADRIFVSRLVGGAWRPPEEGDARVAAPSSPPVLAARGRGG